MKSKQKPRGRELLLGVVSILLVLFATAIVMEGVLRLAGVRPASRGEVGEKQLGFVTQPNMKAQWKFPEYQGTLMVRTNNLGFMEDTDAKPEKPPGTVRVAVVGDSQTQGICNTAESYPNFLEAKLNAAAAREGGRVRYDVINAGVGRYSPYQYLLKTRLVMLPLNPDEIIVGLYLGNDLQDMTRTDDRPYVTLGPAGELVHHPAEWVVMRDPDEQPSWLEKSRVYGLLYNVGYRPFRYQITRARALYSNMPEQARSLRSTIKYLAELKALDEIGNGLLTQCLYQLLWFEYFPNTKREAAELNAAVVKEFGKLCAGHGCRVTFALIPSKLSIEPEQAAAMLEKVRQLDPRLTLEKLQAIENEYRSVILKAAEGTAVHVVDLKAGMLRLKGGKKLYYSQDMHLTPAGNEVVAAILAEDWRGRH
jgi:hypothetical protein